MPADPPSDLFWPGDERAGDVFGDVSMVRAMVRVEWCWLHALAAAGIAPDDVTQDLPDEREVVGAEQVVDIARAAEAGAHPVLPLLAVLRDTLRPHLPKAARWLHRGITSQDVVDTALQLCLRDALAGVRVHLKTQIDALAQLAVDHEHTVMSARTLTQHAVPITFGGKAARWMNGVLDARDAVDQATARLPAQVGGAAGTLSALVAMARSAGLSRPEEVAIGVAEHTAEALGLVARPAWHTNRAPVTRPADALVTCTDAWGHIANDVLTLCRPEIGELTEPTGPGRGGSSTMPHKTNPVLSVLIRRAALSAPPLAATLHMASADAVDERPGGAWQAEWSALRTLARHALTAGSQTSELLVGLRVDGARMARTVQDDAAALLSEQQIVTDLYAEAESTDDPSAYLGVEGLIIESAIARAREIQEEKP